MMKQVRRWLPNRRLVVVVDGGFAAVSLALARPSARGQTRSQPRARDTPTVLAGLGRALGAPLGNQRGGLVRGKRKPLWVFARTGLWYTPRLPPVALRYVLVCDPEGKRRLAVCCWTNLDAPPAQILPWGVMRWSVEVTCEETRAYLRLETQRQWSDHALARTIPIRLALGSLVTGRAWQLSHGGHLPVPVTAWARTAEPPFADCLALVRGHLWRARYVVNSTPAAGVDAIAS